MSEEKGNTALFGKVHWTIVHDDLSSKQGSLCTFKIILKNVNIYIYLYVFVLKLKYNMNNFFVNSIDI